MGQRCDPEQTHWARVLPNAQYLQEFVMATFTLSPPCPLPIELMNIKPLWNFKIKACCAHIRADEWRATELFLLYSKSFFFRNSAVKPGISRPGPKKPGATEAPESQLLDPIRSLLSCLNLSDIIFRINLDFWATLPSFLGALWQIFYTHLSFDFPLYWCGWWWWGGYGPCLHTPGFLDGGRGRMYRHLN